MNESDFFPNMIAPPIFTTCEIFKSIQKSCIYIIKNFLFLNYIRINLVCSPYSDMKAEK